MSPRLGRVAAIVRVDLVGRLRRPATLVTFLALCALAYLWVPDPSTGWALMVVDRQRALYNSAAMALATALLCSFFLGLLGYYLVSQSLGRDARSRCGFVIASTPISNLEYLVGKSLGNAVYLAALALGYMVSSMAMQLVRGEAPIELGAYLWHYGLLVPPAILFVSGVAVLFESVPRLAGKLGDVCYFFLWMLLMGATAGVHEATGGVNPLSYVDVTGMPFAIFQLMAQAGTESLAIGANSFDAGTGIYVFDGLEVGGEWLAPRLVSTLAPPLVTLLLALAAFHRFDPERLRLDGGRRGKGYLRRLNGLVRPLVGRALARLLRGLGSRPSFAGAVAAEVALTLILSPLGAVALAACAVASAVVPSAWLPKAVLPAALAVTGVLVADVACREQRSGTASMVAAMPRLLPRFTWWKLGAAAVLALAFTLVAAVRLALSDPGAALPALAGAFFVAAAATGLGLLAGTPKAFLVLFLSFLYVVINDGGRTPGLDFAGFFSQAGPAVAAGYLLGAAVLVGVAHAVHARRLAV